jgi:hypothetical protein
MKLFIQDHSWAGASIVVAEDEKQAREFLKNEKGLDCYYDENKPFDSVLDCVPGARYEVFGDR